MLLIKKSLRKNAPLTLLLGFIVTLFLACPGPVIEKPPASPEQLAFYTAWMADCTADTLIQNDTLSVGLSTLLGLGKAKLEGALNNSALQKFYGDLGTTPAWGPAISAALTTVPIFSKTGTVTDNLMYVTMSTFGPTTTYNIGIAGTNRVSPFGWFTEDFKVQNHVNWDNNDASKGAIAEGSKIGLDILLGLSHDGQSILDFITSAAASASADSPVEINVAGHSLGGALAPLLALYLKERITNENCGVSSWAYAGPTPGNAEFADYMVSTLGNDNYHAFINSRDVVPHAWQLDSLDRLCTIYADLQDTCVNFPGNLVPGSIVPAFTNWAITQSSADDFKYQIAGDPVSFEGGAMPFDSAACAGVDFLYSNIKGVALYKTLDSIAITCAGINPPNTNENIYHFLAYFAELGFQHSYPYMGKFFPNEAISDTVSLYAQGGVGNSFAEELIQLGILSNLMTEVNANTTTSECNCPDQE